MIYRLGDFHPDYDGEDMGTRCCSCLRYFTNDLRCTHVRDDGADGQWCEECAYGPRRPGPKPAESSTLADALDIAAMTLVLVFACWLTMKGLSQ